MSEDHGPFDLHNPAPLKGRPFEDIGPWIPKFQAADDAAHELIGRIVVKFGEMEYYLTQICIGLVKTGAYTKNMQTRTTFPALISKKLDFVRFCLVNHGPIYRNKKFGLPFCTRLRIEFSDTRVKYTHSLFRLNLLHSQDGVPRFSREIIDRGAHSGEFTYNKVTIGIDDLNKEYARIRRLSQFVLRCLIHLRKRGVPC